MTKHDLYRWSLLWPDKTTLTADSPEQIIERLAAVQWMQPCTRQQMRARLVDRAEVWAGIQVSEDLSDADLLRSLSSIGMFALIEPIRQKGK